MVNRYEIEVYGMEDEDMMKIQHALYTHNISDAGDGESGAYCVYGKRRSVFVDPEQVGLAVGIINELGFQTDEDTQDNETEEQVILSVGESGTAPAARRNTRMSETEAREKIATYTEKSANRELGKMLYRNSDGGWEVGETAYIVRPTDTWWHKYV